MKKTAIAVIEAARFLPDREKVCTGRDLTRALAGADLSPAEARDWHKDLAAAGKKLRKQPDKWRFS